MNSEDLLWHWCRQGWNYRGMPDRPQEEKDWIAQQVKFEMNLIISKGFADFFLVVSDWIRWAKDNGIAVGPGRGSVSASAVAWLLRITEVNPHDHPGLLFARFLDETRPDPPDIDTDFEDDRRAEVRAYGQHKYGYDCVGQVANFTRYRGKNSLVDVARVYEVPIAAKEIVSNLIVERSGGDLRFDATLEDTVEMFPAAKAVFDAWPKLWEATRLEGNVRGMGKHAAGLVVANSSINDLCAIYERDGDRVMAIDKYDVEYAGALKLDFLGLTTMSIIARCLRMIDMPLEELYAIPLDDQRVFQAFRDLDLTGIFQFEGRATRLVTRDVAPRDFAELADINCLSRPGPLFSGTTAAYVDVRHGKRKAERLHPVIDEVTKLTKGQIIYQEQILQILKEIGGFDTFKVTHIRRIISKKQGVAAFQMDEQTFKEGAERLHGISADMSGRLWKTMVTAGAYTFVKAHCISYTIIGYWTMWLKVYHPTEFLAASLSKCGSSKDEKAHAFELMKDALAHDIDVHPPLIEHSKATWDAVPGLGLVAGWRSIKGIGEVTAQRIQEFQENGGTFDVWEDLQAISGIGPKTVERMREFANTKDPFELYRTERIMESTREYLRQTPRIPTPTHTGAEIAKIVIPDNGGRFAKGPEIVYAGIPISLNMQDVIENRRSRTGQETEEILKGLKRPDLLKFCSIRCKDDSGEDVYIRVNRFVFPRLRRTIASMSINHDVLVVVGNPIAGFGTPVMAENFYLIDPED